MKTITSTATIRSKTSLWASCLAFLLAAFTTAFSPQWASATDNLPFKGRAEGAVVNASPGPAGVLLTVLAEGQATHLGRFFREESLLLDPGTGIVAGTITFTAANGDQLTGVVAGQFTSPTTVAGTYTFTGGTGRFENAGGEVGFLLSTPDGIHFNVEFNGSLSSAVAVD